MAKQIIYTCDRCHKVTDTLFSIINTIRYGWLWLDRHEKTVAILFYVETV